MSQAIWLIMYDIASGDEDKYLAWFHDVHMPEKLARPGYTWAAHYEVVGGDGGARRLDGSDSDGQRGFVAFFGGEDTRTFLNPSPAQIKPTQPPLTREMMGCRINSQMLIATEEWRAEAQAGDGPTFSNLTLSVCRVDGNDEDYGGWCIQSYLPSVSEAAGFEVSAKFIATTAPGKHVLVASFSSLAESAAAFRKELTDDWSQRVKAYQNQSTGAPLLLRCISRQS